MRTCYASALFFYPDLRKISNSWTSCSFRKKFLETTKEKNRSIEMKYICIKGQKIYVTEEVYIAYKEGERKNDYFTKDLKRERMVINNEEGDIKIIRSREDSLERLTYDCEKEFADETENTEDEAVMTLMLAKMRDAVMTLSDTEKHIIYGLFFEDKTAKKIAEELGVSVAAICKRKRNILKKLRKIIEN